MYQQPATRWLAFNQGLNMICELQDSLLQELDIMNIEIFLQVSLHNFRIFRFLRALWCVPLRTFFWQTLDAVFFSLSIKILVMAKANSAYTTSHYCHALLHPNINRGFYLQYEWKLISMKNDSGSLWNRNWIEFGKSSNHNEVELL